MCLLTSLLYFRGLSCHEERQGFCQGTARRRISRCCHTVRWTQYVKRVQDVVLRSNAVADRQRRPYTDRIFDVAFKCCGYQRLCLAISGPQGTLSAQFDVFCFTLLLRASPSGRNSRAAENLEFAAPHLLQLRPPPPRQVTPGARTRNKLLVSIDLFMFGTFGMVSESVC